jgi:hypothetical protein
LYGISYASASHWARCLSSAEPGLARIVNGSSVADMYLCSVPSESVTFHLPLAGLPGASTHMPNNSRASFMLCWVLWVAQPPVQSTTSPLGLTRTMSVACSRRMTSPVALS